MFRVICIFFCFLFIVSVVSEEDVVDNRCRFDVGPGEFIDLSGLDDMHVELEECGEPGHALLFNLCKDLSIEDCESVETTGPTNACDLYESGDDKSSYWVGGLGESWIRSEYNEDKQEFVLTYNGEVQTMVHPFWTRTLEVTVKCDPDLKLKVECLHIDSTFEYATTYYKMTLHSKDACPRRTFLRQFGIFLVTGTMILFSTCICCIISLAVSSFFIFVILVCVIITGTGFFIEFGKFYLDKIRAVNERDSVLKSTAIREDIDPPIISDDDDEIEEIHKDDIDRMNTPLVGNKEET